MPRGKPILALLRFLEYVREKEVENAGSVQSCSSGLGRPFDLVQLTLCSVAAGQVGPSGGANAGRAAGLKAASDSGNGQLSGQVGDGSVKISFGDIPRPGMSRNDRNGNGEMIIKEGMSPEDTTAAILHEYKHIREGHEGGGEYQDVMCEEAVAAQACADGLIDCTSNPDLTPPFVITCALKAEIIDQYNNASWGCSGAIGPPLPPNPEMLGPVFAGLPCKD